MIKFRVSKGTIGVIGGIALAALGVVFGNNNAIGVGAMLAFLSLILG